MSLELNNIFASSELLWDQLESKAVLKYQFNPSSKKSYLRNDFQFT